MFLQTKCSIRSVFDMRFNHNNPVKWLIDCPTADRNFKENLKIATIRELRFSLDKIPLAGNKIKRQIIEREIKNRTK